MAQVVLGMPRLLTDERTVHGLPEMIARRSTGSPRLKPGAKNAEASFGGCQGRRLFIGFQVGSIARGPTPDFI
jgi:hypothetical protein